MLIHAFHSLMRFISVRKDPVAFARSLGVTIGEGSRIFSHELGIFGSEPYLVTLGKNCFITFGVRFITHDGAVALFRDKYPDADIIAPIILGDNVFIGACSLILPGTKIGNNVIIGAGSIVTGVIPDNGVYVGSPARKIKTIEEYEQGLLLKSVPTGQMRPADKAAFLKGHF